MNRRDKAKPPREGMVWSEKHGLWMDRDDRTAGRRMTDEAIAQAVEKDQNRIQEALRRARQAQDRQMEVVEGAAENLVASVLGGLLDARKKAGLTQVEVARRMSVPQSAVVRLESGTHSPTLTTLSRYAAAIGVKLEVRRIA